MTNYLIEKDDRVFVKSVSGYRPKNSIGVVPASIQPEDFPYVRYREIPSEESEEIMIKEIYLDEDAKSAGQAENLTELRNSKLRTLRGMKNQKLQECDNIVRDLALGLRSDQIPIREYRQALKDLTDDYKYANDNNRGKATLDQYADDMSDFVWPVKP